MDSHGSSSCSIDAARSGCSRAAHEHAHEPRVVVGGLEAHGHVGAQRLDGLLLAHADDAAARAGHSHVGDVGGAAGKNARIGGRDVGVGAHHGGHPAVEEPAHPDLLAGRLGVDVDQDVVDLALELAEDGVDLDEGRAARAQEEVAAEVDDSQPRAVALDDRPAVAGLRRR